MSQTNINIGTVANDGTGTALRTAFGYINTMLTEVYASVTALLSDASAHKAAGFMHFTPGSAATVTVAGAGAFLGVGGLTDFAGSELVNFTLDNDGTNQVLTYTGTATLTCVQVIATLNVVASAGTKNIEARIAKNGAVETIKGPVAFNPATTSITVISTLSLVTNDKIKVMVANNDDAVSVLVSRLSLAVRR